MIANDRQEGFALVTVLVLIALLMAMLLSHFSLTWIEMSTTRSSMNSFVGFYAAEAGLNVRADSVREAFQGWGLPTGESPETGEDYVPCHGNNTGSGDFECVAYNFQSRDVVTYVEETQLSTNPIVIPRGENFKNLYGHEYHYVVYASAQSPAGFPEAVLEMHFKSRQVPLFQFAAFYDKDLEILPVDARTLQGPVHANGDLYLDASTSLDMLAQVTVARNLYRGRKDADTCAAAPVSVNDPDDLTELPACSSGRTVIPQASVTSWNGMIDADLNAVTLPNAVTRDPGENYWDAADLRVMLDLTASPPKVQIREINGSVDVAATAVLTACNVAAHTTTFYNQREARAIDMLDVDVQGLLSCLHVSNMMGYDIDDTTDGGLVWYLGVLGPDAAGINGYGVRVSNGSEIMSPVAGAPTVAGLTIVSSQAAYIRGDYNIVNKKPASFLADTINVLSNNWNDVNSALTLPSRQASDTEISAGFLGGTDTTGGVEGDAGQDLGGYNGGLLNMIRYHEDWTGDTLTFVGSIVSLDNPLHASGGIIVGAPQFLPPALAWTFDEDFEDPLLLPPLSPLFVYLKQELFVRQFEL